MQTGLLFLIDSLFTLYLFILMLRLWLVFVGANYFDPITQFVIKLTDFIVKPIRRICRNIGRIEVATLLIILVIELIKFSLSAILIGLALNPIGLLLLSFGDMIKLLIDVLFYAILAKVIFSWIQPYSSTNKVLDQLTAPIMYPVQKRIPPVGGIDISPIFVLIGLQFLNFILVQPILMMGWRMMTT